MLVNQFILKTEREKSNISSFPLRNCHHIIDEGTFLYVCSTNKEMIGLDITVLQTPNEIINACRQNSLMVESF